MQAALRIIAASAALAGVSWVVWDLLDGALGRSTIAQAVSLGVALARAGPSISAAILALRVPEARQLLDVTRR